RETEVALEESAAQIFLRDPDFDPIALMDVYQSLTPEVQQRVLPNLLPRYLERFARDARQAKTREEFLKAFRGAKEIFRMSYGRAHDMRAELREHPQSA